MSKKTRTTARKLAAQALDVSDEEGYSSHEEWFDQPKERAKSDKESRTLLKHNSWCTSSSSRLAG